MATIYTEADIVAQTTSRLELTLAKGRLSIHGRPDPETLRLVLQVLTA